VERKPFELGNPFSEGLKCFVFKRAKLVDLDLKFLVYGADEAACLHLRMELLQHVKPWTKVLDGQEFTLTIFG